MASPRSIVQRINLSMIDSLLSLELLNRGINMPYNYAVTQTEMSNIIAINNPAERKEVINSSFKTNLFPNDIKGEAAWLYVDFPGEESYLMNKIWISLVSSGALILIILFCLYGRKIIILPRVEPD